MQYRFQSGGKIYAVSLEPLGSGFKAVMDGVSYQVEVLDEKPGQLSLLFNDSPTVLYWALDGENKWVSLEGCTYLLEKPASQPVQRLRQQAGQTSVEDILRAPMPAQVRALQAAEGDWLEKGQTLVILEAMKMEIRIQAPQAGRLIRLLVSEGQSVDRNQVLAEIRQAVP